MSSRERDPFYTTVDGHFTIPVRQLICLHVLEWTPSGDGLAMQPGAGRVVLWEAITGPSSGMGDRVGPSLRFLLLGSGSGDWAAGQKSQHPEHQATVGCQRPLGHHQDFLQPCLATVTAHSCQRAWIAFSWWHRSRSFGSQPCCINYPMSGRTDKVGGSASLCSTRW